MFLRELVVVRDQFKGSNTWSLIPMAVNERDSWICYDGSSDLPMFMLFPSHFIRTHYSADDHVRHIMMSCHGKAFRIIIQLRGQSTDGRCIRICRITAFQSEKYVKKHIWIWIYSSQNTLKAGLWRLHCCWSVEQRVEFPVNLEALKTLG